MIIRYVQDGKKHIICELYLLPTKKASAAPDDMESKKSLYKLSSTLAKYSLESFLMYGHIETIPKFNDYHALLT